MTGLPAYSGTIPRLLAAAAERDPDGTWLRTDDAAMSFAEAAQRTAGLAEALRAAGIRRGDLVITTARTTPPYLLCWLALASLGAVTVPVNPRSAPAELAGLVRQVAPRALITDAGLAGLVDGAGVAGLPELGVLDADALLAAATVAGNGAGPGCRMSRSRATWRR